MAIWQIVGELIIGFTLLIFSAHYFIKSSANLAYYFKVPRLLIGVLLIGFGTSLPELIVSIFAGLAHSPNIAIGNVIGSNIANIGLVLGVTAICSTIEVDDSFSKFNWPALMIFSLMACYFLYNDNKLSSLEGGLLLLALLIFIFLLIKRSRIDAIAVGT